MLKSISIHAIHEPAGDPIGAGSLGFLRASDIHSFSITGSGFRLLDSPLRWDHLTVLSVLSARTSQTFRQAFSRCPQLRICRLLVRDTFGNDYEVAGPTLELPFLHTLDINYLNNPSTTIHKLFTRLSLPQLRYFKLRGRARDQQDISYSPFLSAAPSIELLDLNTESFSKASLAEFLLGLPPTVREIKITTLIAPHRGPSGILQDDILELLIPSPELPVPCFPRLETLEIHRGCHFSDDAIARLVKSRTLKRLVLYLARELQGDIRPDLQPLMQRGLYLELVYHPPVVVHFSPWEGVAITPKDGGEITR
ncbi:hypothetical protein DFH09DRAFT_1152042 [Mycena vulgaris]|nr:hypothetical protein DFH09DRAFT_1152042 [Mycena vulgaris]